MEKKIKFAVVGCGHIGKRHAEMISRNEEAELVALCDVRDASELDIEKYNVPFYSSLTELLKNEKDVDVVNICTPNGLHAKQSVEVLTAGHHVVCEKPLVTSLRDADAVWLYRPEELDWDLEEVRNGLIVPTTIADGARRTRFRTRLPMRPSSSSTRSKARAGVSRRCSSRNLGRDRMPNSVPRSTICSTRS